MRREGSGGGHRRLRVLGLVLVLALVGGGVAAAVLLLSGSSQPRRIFREALELRVHLKPARLLHLRPTHRFPHVPLLERRRLDRVPKNEAPRPPTRAAPPHVDFITSTSASATVAKAPADGNGGFELGQSGRFVHANADLVAEPTVAAHGSRILTTWNWGAALSSDGGQSFTFLDPDRAFPSVHEGFCCDQVAHYAAAADLWVWLLQYEQDARGNVLRLAFAKGNAAFDAGRANASAFRYVDISPHHLGWPKSAWFDFNGVASTRKNLFIATNVATRTDYEGVVLRIPLADVVRGSIKRLRLVETAPYTTPRLVQGAAGTMYFAAHVDASKLRVWSWADGSSRVARVDVRHSAYRHPARYTCPRVGAPATADWCEGFRDGDYKNDDSILAGWLADGRVGFAWNAGQDSEHGFQYPFVMAVEIDAHSLKRVGEPIIWSPDYAYQYPSVVPNDAGKLGGVAVHGGGTDYETCTALLRDPGSSDSWQSYSVDTATSDPAHPEAGDYLGASPAGPSAHEWAAACPTPRGNTDDAVGVGIFTFRGR